MGQSGSQGDPHGNPNRRIGRLRAAWLVLMGQRLTPQQIELEWAEYRETFQTILERWSASLARQAKAERKRIERLHEAIEGEPTRPVASGHAGRKAELRQRAAQRGLILSRGGSLPMPHMIPGPQVTEPEEDD